MFEIGDRVIITGGFFATEEAKLKAIKQGIENFVPIGNICKIPGDNDDFIPKEESGNTYDMWDHYGVTLDESPFSGDKRVNYLSEGDITLA